MRQILSRTAPIVGLAFLAGIAFAAGSALTQRVLDPWSQTPPNFLTQPLVRSQGMGLQTVPAVVEKASQAVVKITSTTVVTTQPSPNIWNPFNFETPTPGPQEEVSLGTGFIISTTGTILTNQHVVNGASSIQVAVVGYNRPFKAKVIGQDYDLDLAVLQIDAPKPLPVLPLAAPTPPPVGEWVVAIGNPYGLSHTVTLGVISAEGRPITLPGSPGRSYRDLLQTDAAINPGNSGGPLLNLSGQVVGINTAVSSQGQGIGFAIPVSTVRSVLGQLIAKGFVVRSWLGVTTTDLDPSLANYLGVRAASGAVITGIYKGGPAAVAGLGPGDVIVSFDGKAVASSNRLSDLTEALKPGTKGTITALRGSQTLHVTVTLTQRPPNL